MWQSEGGGGKIWNVENLRKTAAAALAGDGINHPPSGANEYLSEEEEQIVMMNDGLSAWKEGGEEECITQSDFPNFIYLCEAVLKFVLFSLFSSSPHIHFSQYGKLPFVPFLTTSLLLQFFA